MKDRAIQIGRTEGEADKNRGRNLLREYLQHLILRELFELGELNDLIFHGGTALRMIHDLDRFSEDLDFHLSEPDPDYDLSSLVDNLEKRMKNYGYTVEATDPGSGPVASSFLKYEELLYEADLSAHQEEKLNIKIEIDTNPPHGFTVDSSFVSEYMNFSVRHHDRPSFLAGKYHAVTQRTYTKGRDYFDLFFYIHEWKDVTPNFPYLNNALQQTGYEGPRITETNWREQLLETVREIDWEEVKSDVEPFLSRPSDLKAFRKNLLIEELKTKPN